MIIREIDNSNDGSYDVLATEDGTVFDSIAWLRLFSNLKIFGIYNKGDNLIGGFHLYLDHKAGMTFLRNAPFTPFFGIFLNNKAVNRSNFQSFEKKAISVLAEYIDKLPAAVVSLAFNRNYRDLQPFIWKKFKVIPNYTYIIDLSESVEKLLENMSPERRNDLKKAGKDHIITRKNNEPRVLQELIMMTFNRKEKTISQPLINKILTQFANGENSFSFVSYKEDIPIAGAFCIHDSQTAYYLLSGYDSGNKHHGAGASAVWACIQHARSLNLKWFDFEGSMIQPVEAYFRGFGGRITPYFTVNKALLPLEVALKLLKREIF